jgi:hypothetical protein
MQTLISTIRSWLAVILLASAGAPFVGKAADAVTLDTSAFRFSLSPDTGTYEILDKRAGVNWRSNPLHSRFGRVTLHADGKLQSVDLARCVINRVGNGLEAEFHPLAATPAASLRVHVRPIDQGQALEFSYQTTEPLAVEEVRLLDDGLWVSDADPGYIVVPVREGLLIPADSELAFTQRFDTFAYEGCHMEMLGVVKQGAAALVTWHDPYAAAEVRSTLTNVVDTNGKQLLSTSLVLRKSATSFQLHVLGKGDYVTIAGAYRRVAQQKGWRVPWTEKLKSNPTRARLFGAINFKLWSALDRRMNEDGTREESFRVNWTFSEAAQVAEHLKRDLQLDKVLFILGGWIHRGYDNQHPDILPAAPECGGDTAFADCARRVRQLGYLFCLHDNYQDIYRDSPSWNEAFVMKNQDGSLARGGHWAGGRAYLTCSETAVDLAQRPQNLVAVKKLTDADAYFIDTTYAAGLQECFDRNHPLTRWDDLKWKQAISDYGRRVFGMFGSECGREWAIPHADFFEGLTGVSGHAYHDAALPARLGATVVPLFELVYRDCIAMYGKYGYDPARAAEYVLQHISLGRPLNYHSIPAHLYWKEPPRAALPPPAIGTADLSLFTRAEHGWAEGLHPMDRFVKNTYEILSPLNELTAQLPLTEHQFLTADRKVQRTVFGSGPGAVEVIVNLGPSEFRNRTRSRKEVVLPTYGFLVESPGFVALQASNWNDLRYEVPTLFTIRSLDGKPLSRSGRARVFHAFGDSRLKLWTTIEDVPTERVLTRATR